MNTNQAAKVENGVVIDILYFARIAELTGKRKEQLPLPESVTVNEWLTQLNARYPALSDVRVLKVAVNKKHVPTDTLIHDRDEVAIFEPVTGG
ncbi:MAG: molybdopterin converting factor subunit 1 [Advenella sp.]